MTLIGRTILTTWASVSNGTNVRSIHVRSSLWPLSLPIIINFPQLSSQTIFFRGFFPAISSQPSLAPCCYIPWYLLHTYLHTYYPLDLVFWYKCFNVSKSLCGLFLKLVVCFTKNLLIFTHFSRNMVIFFMQNMRSNHPRAPIIPYSSNICLKMVKCKHNKSKRYDYIVHTYLEIKTSKKSVWFF